MTLDRHYAWLAGLLLTGLMMRAGVAWQRSDELRRDVDAYLGIAEGLAAGRGYSAPDTTSPTAYRPPLYPVLLSVCKVEGAGRWVAAINIVTGVSSVCLTWLLSRLLHCRRSVAMLAALLVAVDPLLVRYASLPMTENLGTFLVTLLLVHLASPSNRTRRWPQLRPIVTGLLFGLCVLCRPTVWAFGALASFWMIVRFFCVGEPDVRRQCLKAAVGASLGCIVVVAPWAIRNANVFGRPIVTTTHGGYTLLLGNNPSYWQEVVKQPMGTVWDGSHGTGQAAWIAEVQREMLLEGVSGELAQDEWMKRRAWRHIQDDPAMFLRACLHRFLSFWNVSPSGEAEAEWPRWVTISVASFYVLLFATAVIGLLSILRARDLAWLPPLLMVAAFCGVHLVYWSNVRMRAPVVPVIAILSAHGVIWLLSRILRRGNRFG